MEDAKAISRYRGNEFLRHDLYILQQYGHVQESNCVYIIALENY